MKPHRKTYQSVLLISLTLVLLGASLVPVLVLPIKAWIQERQANTLNTLKSNDKHLHTFNFTKSEWDALNKNKDNEFRLGDRLYDIYAITTTASEVQVICLIDTDESNLEKINRLFQRAKNSEKELAFQATYLSLFHEKQADYRLLSLAGTTVCFQLPQQQLSPIYLTFDAPPPRFNA